MTDFEAEYDTANASLARLVQDRFPKREPASEDSDASVMAELDSASDTDGDSDYVPPHMQRSDGDDASPTSLDEATIKKEAESATSTELILGEAATKSAPGKRKTRPASREKRTSRGPTKRSAKHQSDMENGGKQKRWICKFCGKILSSGRFLNNHTARFHSLSTSDISSENDIAPLRAKRFCCHVCGKSFQLKNGLDNHSKLHTGERPYKCQVCGKSFIQKGGLKVHALTHAEKKPYQCHICEKSYCRSRDLDDHLMKHSGTEPFPCDICDKSFATCSKLQRHLVIHSGELPHPCNICERRFADRGNLRAHMRKLHPGLALEMYPCSVCHEVYTEKASRDRHCQAVHSGAGDLERVSFCCLNCRMSFPSRAELAVHSRQHDPEKRSCRGKPAGAFRCHICQKLFPNRSRLNGHIVCHDPLRVIPRPHGCEVCGKKFQNRCDVVVHMRTHSGERPFQCEVCRRKFSVLSNMSRHRCVPKDD